ncbi:hypothetical protein AMTRI_Chr01g135210 [Amborella trichopoda]
MGNKIARTTQVSASEYYLHDLPSSYNLVLKEVLGRGRFFKSIQCKHDEGLVLVKVYFKRGDPLDLKDYERRLHEIREIFRNIEHSHVWPFQYWLETDKAAYLLRQYFFSNLHDRLSTRPFLSLIEKKWLAFQLLYAVKQSHDNGVCHGDIKCENVLVTSWNWLYLADFASFKPTYIPDDDPSDFSFFFDTGGRRRCYLAPERFYEHGGEMHVTPDAPLRPSMDIFSLGCVIAELFLEGQPLFELSQLLAYRRGQYDPAPYLEKISDSGIRKMILHMIQLDSGLRLSADSYLQSNASSVFPSYFSPLLHNFFSCLIPLDSDTRVLVTQSFYDEILKKMMHSLPSGEVLSESFKSADPKNENQDQKLVCLDGNSSKNDEAGKINFGNSKIQLVGDVTALFRDIEKTSHHSYAKPTFQKVPVSASGSDTKKNNPSLQKAEQNSKHSSIKLHPTIANDSVKKNAFPAFGKKVESNLASLMTQYDSESDTLCVPSLSDNQNGVGCDVMVLIASLLCSCLRSVKLPQLRRAAVILLKSSQIYIDDEDRLQHVLPFVIAMLSDPAAIVRCAALQTLCDILPLVRDFPPSDAKIFPEYILPMLSMLPDDPEESVRICYASNISQIAITSYRYLMHSQKLGEAGVLDKLSSPRKASAPAMIESSEHMKDKRSDAQLGQLRKTIAEVVQELVMGPKQTPNIRRALLQGIGWLCCFFGQRQSNDLLLPILPAFLNDRDEQLRAVFYEQIVFVCFFVGQRSVEEYLLPYIEQALSDGFEAVIVNALQCLALLCRRRFLRKRILLEMIERASPLLCYPSEWVRRSAISFVAACSECLEEVDSYVYLPPLLRPFLRRDPSSLSSEASLSSCLTPLVSKRVFQQVIENSRNPDMLDRQRKIWYHSASYPKRDEDPSALRSWVGKQPDQPGNRSFLTTTRHEIDNTSKSYMHNTSKSAAHTIENPVNSENLQFSGLSAPHISGGNSVLCDGPSEGIPLYSFFVDKRPDVGPTTTSSQWGSVGVGSSSSMMSKSIISLASSTAPKHALGSFFNVNNGNKQVYKVVREGEGREADQASHLAGKIKDISISGMLRGASSSSLALSDEAIGPTSFARAQSVADIWRPRGVLVAHLQEHHLAVNDIAVSSDHSFFVSASDDSTVKVWDTRKLEKDISFRSRLTYPLDGSRGLCVTMVRGGPQVAVSASDGTIRVFSVDYVSRGSGSIERYLGISDVDKRNSGEGAVSSLLDFTMDHSSGPMLLYSTRGCGVHLWDLRDNSNAWTLQAVPEQGHISSVVTGPCGTWFVSGSSRGVLTLWDLRFLIPVNSWEYPISCPVEKMCLLIPPSGASLSSMARPLVYVAAGCNEVALWNAENGSCHEVFRLANNEGHTEMADIPWALARPSSKATSKLDAKRNVNPKYRVNELNEPPPRLPGIRSLLPLSGGDLLTGGTDFRIRRWDHCSPDRSYCVCGPTTSRSTGCDEYYDTRSSFGVQVVQETSKRPSATKLTSKALLTAAATDTAGCHRDSILSLASVKLNQRLLISSSRDGAIKVWK